MAVTEGDQKPRSVYDTPEGKKRKPPKQRQIPREEDVRLEQKQFRRPVERKPVDVHAIVPHTGESFFTWFQRRAVQVVQEFGSKLSEKDILSLAGSSIPDAHLGELGRIARQVESAPDAAKLYMGEAPGEQQSIFGPDLSEAFGVPEADLIVKAAVNKAARETGKSEGPEFEKSVIEFAEIELRKAGLVGDRPRALVESVFTGAVSGLEKIWKPIDDVLGVGAQYAGTALGKYSNLVNEKVLRQEKPSGGGVFQIGAEKRDFPSLRKAWENAVHESAGANFAASAGLKPGTAAYKVSSGSFDFVARWYLDPTILAGKAVKGARLAARVPEGALQERSIITRGVYKLLSKDADTLVAKGRAQAGIDALWDYSVRGESPVAIRDRFRLPYAKALEVSRAESRSEIQEIIRAGLKGESFIPIAEVEGRIAYLAEQAKTATGEAASKIAGETRELEQLLSQGPLRSRLLTQIPEDTQLGAFRQAVKRGIGKTPLAKVTEKVLGNSWAQGPFRYFPGSDISMVDRELGSQNFERLASSVFKLPRKQVDELLEKYLGSSGREQAVQAYFDLLKAGAAKLDEVAPGLGDDLTKLSSRVTSKGGYIGEDGTRKWVKTRVDAKGRREVFGQPHLDNEIADALPVPNVEAIRNVLSLGGRIRARLTRPITMLDEAGKEIVRPNRLVSGLNRIPGGAVIQRGLLSPELAGPVSSVTSYLTSVIWKPLVLLRVGWSVKQIAEADLRMASLGLNSVYTHPFSLVDDAKQFAKLATKEDAEIALQQQLIERSVYARSAEGVVLTPSDLGHHLAWQDEIVTLRQSRIVQYYLNHGEEQTLEWLKHGAGKRYWNDVSPIAEGIAENVDDYLRTIEERISVAAPTRELREAVRTGDYGKSIVTDRTFAQALKDLSDDIKPWVQNTVSVERLHDPQKVRRVVSELFNRVGSKPYDFFVNKPAWVGFYKKRYAEVLDRLGEGAEKVARSEARAYANATTVHFLHDLGERSAFHRQVRNIAPFMPAYQKTLEQWLINIPSQYGVGLGHAYQYERAKMIFEAGKEMGLIRKDPNGQWEVMIPGLTQVFQKYLGIEGTVKAATVFSWFTDFPFSGPAVTIPLGGKIQEIYNKYPKSRELIDLMFQYGPTDSVGARYMGYGMRALGAPDWAEGLVGLSPKALDHQFFMEYAEQVRQDYSRWKALSDLQLQRASQEALITDPAERKRFRDDSVRQIQDATKGLVADAKERARFKFGIRALVGQLSPFSVSFKPLGQRQKDAFLKSLDDLSPDGRASAREKMLDEHPDMELYLTGTSYRTEAEAKREVGAVDSFSRWALNHRKDYDPETFSQIGMGNISHQAIRREHRRALEEIGGAVDWARNPEAVQAADDEYRLQLDLLESISPEWAAARAKYVEEARGKAGAPQMGFAEERFLEATRAFKDLHTLFELQEDGETLKPEDEIDWKGYRKFVGQLRDKFDLNQFFTGESYGPEKEYADYWALYVNPYLDRLSEIFEKADFAKEVDRDAAFVELREFTNSQETPVINGHEYPTPEEFLYLRKSETERSQERFKWAQGRIEYLSPFRRKTIGLSDAPEAQTYWDAVNYAASLVDEIRKEDRLAPGSKESKNLTAWLKDFKRREAQRVGLEEEFLLSEAKPYVRVFALRQSANPSWDAVGTDLGRVKEGVDAVWEVLQGEGLKGASGKLGTYLKGNLYPWIEGLRESSPTLDAELKYWHSLTVGRRKSRDRFYDYFFFGQLPVGLNAD